MKASLLRVLTALFVAISLAVPALAASDFPNRTVRILVGFAPGGTTDILARIVADELRSKWNTAVVATIPSAPGRLSITTAVFHVDRSSSATIRARRSVVPPGAKPTRILTVLFGKSEAARAGKVMPVTTKSAISTRSNEAFTILLRGSISGTSVASYVSTARRLAEKSAN